MSITTIVRKFKEYSRYRKALSELSMLNDRELADLGLSRCDIYEVARSSAGYTR
jgi:uncharacterized protein YjiS (DUF1127 family)